MKLVEVGNAVQPYRLLKNFEQYQEYVFVTTEHEKYEVVFNGAPIDPDDIVELFPGATREYPNEDTLEKGADWIPVLREAQRNLPTFISYDVTFSLLKIDENGETYYTYLATNKGGKTVYEVFATVRAIILKFMETCEDYDCLVFSAGEPSRQKLYDHFADAIEQYAHFAQIRGPGYGGEKVYVLFDPEALKR